MDDFSEFISIQDLPNHLPPGKNGKKLHFVSCYRWVSKGLRGIKLRTIFLGGARFTTLAWVREFGEAVAAARTDAMPAERIKPARSRRTRREERTRRGA
ncbi:MAG: DUF1580 domain-containing protein [Planctomycetota bacterium]